VVAAMDWMRKYFREYEQRVRTSNSDMRTHHEVSSVSVGSPVLGKRVLEAEFAQYRLRRRTARAHKSELDAYLEEEPMENSTTFDVLAWWKSKSEKYPVLSAMARDFLAIPLSTVSSESAFSCAGRILGDTRTSLKPTMLEALVCAKDWLFKTKDEAHFSFEDSLPGYEESHPSSVQETLSGKIQVL